MPLEHFEQKIGKLQSREEVSILLGNGFSQSWNRDIFNYQSLLNSANFGARGAQLKNIFRELDTFDFEKVMLALESAETIFRNYNIEHHKIDELRVDAASLKTGLIHAISHGHPQRSSHVSTEQYQIAKLFTCFFNKIFTLN